MLKDHGSFAFCLLNFLCVNPSGVMQEVAVLDIAGGLAERRQNSQSTVCIAFPTSGGRYGKQRGTVPKSFNLHLFSGAFIVCVQLATATTAIGISHICVILRAKL